MRSLTFIYLSLIIASLSASAQVSPGKVKGTMEKQKWIKVAQQLRKSISKDSINPEARYLFALYFFNPSNQAYQLDSAYHYNKIAGADFTLVVGRDREKLKKIPLDSMILVGQRLEIDSAAFADATRINTEESYLTFIRMHPTASQVSSAVELRDEVAFLDALKVNTWSSFQRFMQKYPDSQRGKEARDRYERLLYDDKTKDQKLSSFLNFYKQYPDSPFRRAAETKIFEISTASGSPVSFRRFIKNFPQSGFSSKAKNILYAMQEEDEQVKFDKAWMTDSLRQLERLNQKFWVPFLKSGRFGFMDELGAEAIGAKYESILEDYRCGQVTDRLLVTSDGLIARNGEVVLKGNVKEAKALGHGYLLVSGDSGKRVIHESGFRVGRAGISSAQVVTNRFVALQKNQKWSLFTFTGKELLPSVYDDVTTIDTLILLSKGGKRILTTPVKVGQIADRSEFHETHIYDEVRRWATNQYWVRNGVLEGVIGPGMNFIIPLDRHNLKKTNFGFTRTKNERFYVEGVPALANKPFLAIQEQAGWIKLKKETKRQVLFDRSFGHQYEGDSAWFQGQMAFLRNLDSISVFLPAGQRLAFADDTPFHFISFKDSADWLILEDKKNKVVYDVASGVKLLTLEADKMEALSMEEFLVTRGGKKGIISEEGRILIPMEYDAIVPDGPRSYSLLKEKKFGWFDARNKVLIKATFDRNVKSYNREFRTAFRDKGYAFIHGDGKPLGLFEWEEIQYWTDSLAWVKKNFQWMLISIRTGKPKWDRIRSFTFIQDTPQEKICLVKQDNAYGIISNRHGLVVPMQYSDIINLGSNETPVYFTERHIEEAGISVVVYFDRLGKIVRRQAMEGEEFEKIVCEQ